ncbi:MAG TPA: hypothetical protein VJN95_04835 [Gemmatimonadales bacterium]|nr:hypothetical protein [Gemmatimonadales bacterium]
MSYLGAAESVVQGRGLRIPNSGWSDPDSTSELKLFPPGYSLALSIPIRLGIAPYTAGRIVQAGAAFVTVTLTSALALELAGTWAAVMLTAILCLTPALIEDHLSILSEPLYLAMLSVFLSVVVRRPDRPLWHGLAAAAANGVRYIGGSLVAAGTLLALARPGTWRQRITRAAQAALPALLLGALWVGLVRGKPGQPPTTALVADFHLGDALADFRDALQLWLGPSPEDAKWALPLALVVTVLLVGVLLRGFRKLFSEAKPAPAVVRLWAAIGAITLGHFGVLLFSRIFVGHEIPFDSRLMSPLILVFEVLLIVLLLLDHELLKLPRGAGIALVAVLWVMGAGGWFRELWQDVHVDGSDYNDREWRQSPTLDWIRSDSGRARVLFSNHPVPIWFHTGRPSRDLPETSEPDSLAAFARVLDQQHGAVVFFSDTTWDPDVMIDSLAIGVPLRLVAQFSDGRVYVRP